MDVAPTSRTCSDFALLGYCDKGLKCEKRHVFECPDFERTGECLRKESCNLQHVYRAYHEEETTESGGSRNGTNGAQSTGLINIDELTKNISRNDVGEDEKEVEDDEEEDEEDDEEDDEDEQRSFFSTYDNEPATENDNYISL
jgi:hypothetical protein